MQKKKRTELKLKLKLKSNLLTMLVLLVVPFVFTNVSYSQNVEDFEIQTDDRMAAVLKFAETKNFMYSVNGNTVFLLPYRVTLSKTHNLYDYDEESIQFHPVFKDLLPPDISNFSKLDSHMLANSILRGISDVKEINGKIIANHLFTGFFGVEECLYTVTFTLEHKYDVPKYINTFWSDATGEYIYALAYYATFNDGKFVFLKLRTDTYEEVGRINTNIQGHDNYVAVMLNDKIHFSLSNPMSTTTAMLREYTLDLTKEFDASAISSTPIEIISSKAEETVAKQNRWYCYQTSLMYYKDGTVKIILIGKNNMAYSLSSSEIDKRHYERQLQKYENGKWDTISLTEGLSLLNSPNTMEITYPSFGGVGSVINHRIYKWEDDEVVIAPVRKRHQIIGTDTTDCEREDMRTFLIYNLTTNKWRKFVIPKEIGQNIRTFNIAYIRKWQNKFYLGANLVYAPPTSIEDTEARGLRLPNLWVRNIYPNPATATSKITANIMCYLSTVSDVEIGLYDFMGQKVLDLSNHFEYEPATATIHISFVLPKNLSKGSYFLVVRSGTETRTRGIIVK